MLWLCAALHFILLHGPDGQDYYVNTDQVTSLRSPNAVDARSFAKGTKCVVVMSNGKFLSAVEPCRDIYNGIMMSR